MPLSERNASWLAITQRALALSLKAMKEATLCRAFDDLLI